MIEYNIKLQVDEDQAIKWLEVDVSMTKMEDVVKAWVTLMLSTAGVPGIQVQSVKRRKPAKEYQREWLKKNPNYQKDYNEQKRNAQKRGERTNNI